MNKIVKRIFLVSGIVVSTALISAASYVAYVLLSFNRIGDQVLTVDHRSDKTLSANTEYKAISYNIGFGAYSQDFTFFLDTGYDEAGNPTCGYWSKARSKEAVEFNTSGAIATLMQEDADFLLCQEVDTDSTRSYHINQDDLLKNAFPAYDHVHAVNVHTAFLPYPLYDMHGTINGGIATLSRYSIASAERKQYTITDSISRIFDLDRCFSVSVLPVNNGKNLYLVNSHMSAYGDGEKVRSAQVAELNAFLALTQVNGDYVVVGGDWNHDLLTYNSTAEYKIGDTFKYTEQHRPHGETKRAPDWMSYFFDSTGKSPLIDGFTVVASDNVPTCRNNDIPYTPGKTFVCTVDGFVVSSNVRVKSHRTIQTKNPVEPGRDGFVFSDHEPTALSFELVG